MKFLIVSDIHGSAYYTKKVVDAFHQLKCDRILLLGDILYHGPRNDLPKEYDPKQVIQLLNPLSKYIIACRGNCDSEVDQMVLTFPIMNTVQVLPVDNHLIFISHGHLYSEANLPENCNEHDIFISGHTHIPKQSMKDGIHILNPGSVSIPKGNSTPSIATLEGYEFCLYNLEAFK